MPVSFVAALACSFVAFTGSVTAAVAEEPLSDRQGDVALSRATTTSGSSSRRMARISVGQHHSLLQLQQSVSKSRVALDSSEPAASQPVDSWKTVEEDLGASSSLASVPLCSTAATGFFRAEPALAASEREAVEASPRMMPPLAVVRPENALLPDGSSRLYQQLDEEMEDMAEMAEMAEEPVAETCEVPGELTWRRRLYMFTAALFGFGLLQQTDLKTLVMLAM